MSKLSRMLESKTYPTCRQAHSTRQPQFVSLMLLDDPRLLGQGQRILLLMALQAHKFHAHIHSSCPSNSMEVMQKGTGGSCTHSRQVSQNPIFIYAASKPSWPWPKRNILSLLYWTINKSALCCRRRQYLCLTRLYK